MEKIKYFAYGSNMLTTKMKDRVPSAEPVGVAILEGHTLRFHKKSTDESGKGDAWETGDSEDIVWGVVFELNESDKGELDKAEGLGWGYEEKTVDLKMDNGESTKAVTYYATNIDEDMVPYTWYKKQVLYGAVEHGLPDGYIKMIERVETKDDPDERRKKGNERYLPE